MNFLKRFPQPQFCQLGRASRAQNVPQSKKRPNILFVITDDQSWANTGINGDPAIKTPNFNRIAREGVNFLNSYCSMPSCTPSRAAILTGQDFCRLEEGGNLLSALPAKFAVYPDLLEFVETNLSVTTTGRRLFNETVNSSARVNNYDIFVPYGK